MSLTALPSSSSRLIVQQWAVETCFVYPGAIQYYGPTEVCDATTKTLALEQAK